MRGLLRRQHAGAARVRLPAEVTSHEAAAIGKGLRLAIGRCPAPTLVLNFAQVRRVTSSGAGVLFAAAAAARTKGIRLHTEGVGPEIDVQLRKFGLTKILTPSRH